MTESIAVAPEKLLFATTFLVGALLGALRPVAALLVYLWMDYMRPQDVLPVLAEARPMLALATGMLLVSLRDLARGQVTGRFDDWVGVGLLCLVVVPPNVVGWSGSDGVTIDAVEPVKLALVAYLVAHILRERRDFDRALWVIAGSLTVLASYAIWQRLGAGSEYIVIEGPGGVGAGLFADNNDLARALLFGLAMWSAFTVKPQSIKWRAAAMTLCAVLAEGVLFTGSRGGFLALVACGSYLLFAHLRALPAAITTFILLTMMLRVTTPAPVAQRLETIARPAAESSVQSRLDIWQEGLRRAAARPLLGHGLGTFAVPHAKGPEHPPRTAHNIYIELLYEAGSVGLVAYILLLAATMAQLLGLRAAADADAWTRARAVALEASLIGFATASFFLGNAFQSIPFVAVGLSVALRNSSAADK